LVSNIMMSVDMDEWYQCRWATGSQNAYWQDTASFFKDYYKSNKPAGEIIPLTEVILELFDRYDIPATFFFTGEVAGYYPHLVKRVAACGHEIGCHNYVHKDYNEGNPKEFRANLHKSKALLEDLTSSEVIGYRAPNSTVSPYMIEELLAEGFLYDSSVTPTRTFRGKFGNFRHAPRHPYILDIHDFAREGNSGLWEFPWPVFPIFRLPSGSGIMSRIAGYTYTVISLEYTLREGDTVYYFHPYEIGPKPSLPFKKVNTKVFLRNLGEPYKKMLIKLFTRYRGRFLSGKMLYEKLTRQRQNNKIVST
jgi:peptidoglycan/xylan/chitin deacetylase (PgdA/CDA1 family)